MTEKKENTNTLKEAFFNRAHKGEEPSLRKIEPNEIIIEFDHVQRKEGLALVEKVKEILKKKKVNYEIYDHGGKSPHIHIKNIIGLDQFPEDQQKLYKTLFLKSLLPEYFPLMDKTLCNRDHLIATEGETHHKKKLYPNDETYVDYGVKELKEATEKQTNFLDSKIKNEMDKLFKKPKTKFTEVNNANILGVLKHYDLEPDARGILCCPFHADSDPSMKIYPETNSWYCFGCCKGGNVINFVMEMEKCSSGEAIKILKRIQGKLFKTTITTTTNTTNTTNNNILDIEEERQIDPAGEVFEGIVIEPLGNGLYVYTSEFGKKKGVTKANGMAIEGTKKVAYYLKIGDKKYFFKSKPFFDKLPFLTPSINKIKKWISGEYSPPNSKELYENSVKYGKLIFGLDKDIDYYMESLCMFQTWLRPALNSVFHIGRDGTKGSGKTSIGEFSCILARHGRTSGDLSGAVIGRVVEKYQISLHVDEIDQLNGDKRENVEAILRHSQRRDNPYSRCNKDTGELEFHDTFNAHTFSFRKNTEDALRQRSYIVRTKPTKDHRLSLLTSHKKLIGFPLFEDFFFWYMENIANFVVFVVNVVDVVGVLGVIDKKNLSLFSQEEIDKARTELWNIYTQHLTERQKSLLRKLTGRYSEIGYNVLNISKKLGLDIFEYLEEALISKQAEESVSDQIYLSLLEDLLVKIFEDHSSEYVNVVVNKEYKRQLKYVIKRGSDKDCFFYPKTDAFIKYLSFLREKGMPSIDQDRFSGFLKDMGFIEGANIRNQRIGGGLPKKSLVYSEDLLDTLNLSKKSNQKVVEENIENE